MYRNLYIFNTVFLNLVALCTGAWWSRWLTLSRASSWAASRCARGWTQSWTRSGGSTTPSHTSSTPSPGTGCCFYCFQHTFVNYEPALWIPIPITDPDLHNLKWGNKKPNIHHLNSELSSCAIICIYRYLF